MLILLFDLKPGRPDVYRTGIFALMTFITQTVKEKLVEWVFISRKMWVFN